MSRSAGEGATGYGGVMTGIADVRCEKTEGFDIKSSGVDGAGRRDSREGVHDRAIRIPAQKITNGR